MYTSAARLAPVYLMGWIYCLVPKLSTKTVCPRFSTVSSFSVITSFQALSEMHTRLSCCATTKQPMFSRQRRHCVTNSEITPMFPTCVLQTFFCTVHSVRPAPSADSLKNISRLLTGFNVSAARDFSSRQQRTSSRRRGVGGAAVARGRSGRGGKNKMPGVKNHTIL